MKEGTNPSMYEMPKATRLLVLDDLTASNPFLEDDFKELMTLFDTKNRPIVVSQKMLSLRLRKKYEREVEKNRIEPLDIAIAIGSSGKKVFDELRLTMPACIVSPKRVTLEDGSMRIVSKKGISISEDLRSALRSLNIIDSSRINNIGIIDDTVFSGITAKSIIDELQVLFPLSSKTILTLTHISQFSDQHMGENQNVISAVSLRTSKKMSDGLNSLDARDFVDTSAIPLSNGISISFKEEENWMRSWFGLNYEKARNLCDQMQTVYSA